MRRRNDFFLRLQSNQQHLELVERDRLAERAGDVHAHRNTELRCGGEHAAVEAARDQYLRMALERRQLPQQLDAVAPGHLQIEQDYRGRERKHELPEQSRVREHFGLEAKVLSHLTEERTDVGVV